MPYCYSYFSRLSLCLIYKEARTFATKEPLNTRRPCSGTPGRKSFDRGPALFLPRHRGERSTTLAVRHKNHTAQQRSVCRSLRRIPERGTVTFSIAHTDLNGKRSAKSNLRTTCPKARWQQCLISAYRNSPTPAKKREGFSA